jgi:hypothetical protein
MGFIYGIQSKYLRHCSERLHPNILPWAQVRHTYINAYRHHNMYILVYIDMKQQHIYIYVFVYMYII